MKSAVAAGNSRAAYKKRLLQRRNDVLSGMGVRFDTLASMGSVAEDDQAQITHDEFVSLHLNSMGYAELRMVEEALDRLDSGDFGTCLSCEEPIPVKRLRALPWARYCVACQERLGSELESQGEGIDLARAPLRG
jgi:DnaK suppressor protein